MDSPLSELGRRAAAAQDRERQRGPAPSAARVLTDLARRRRARGARRVAALLVVTVSVILLVVAVRPPALTFTSASGRAGQAGAWIAAADSPLRLDFSDGSRVTLQPAARARVLTVDAGGARVVLERGAVDAAIIHRDRTPWHVEAGPFTVHVIGTRFSARWQPEVERLAITLEEGAVMVRGPLLGAGREVAAGETLEVDVPARTLGLRPATTDVRPPVTPPVPSVTAAIEAPGAPPASVTAEPRLAPRPVVRVESPAPPSWRELALAGQYREALAMAEEVGFDRLCASEGPASLLALGDVARFAGDSVRAQQAYLALRRRHPAAPEAPTAAFVLGRMAFDRSGDLSAAAEWFRRCLAEAPRGPFAADASGRLIEVLVRSGDKASARAAAERYLAAHPKGAHAELARAVLGP